ncbi:MAG TPA: branched-chain amino acid ABC transporter permease [Geobacteraceae bacterium]|nr:branched-chain amino acid ABC transporter permease [Geobacteraceae bacterium]
MDSFLSNLVPIIIVGLSLGSLFGLVGLAYTVIINATQLVNFGQGDFAMVGVAVCWALISKLGLPLWVSFPLAVLAGGGMGFITNAAIVTPLLKKDVHPFYPVLGTMSVGTVAAGAVGVFTGFYWMPIEHFFGNEPLKISGVPMDTQGVLIIGTTVAIVTAYWYLLHKTRLGLALRATGFNREVSLLAGIRVGKMASLSFVISGMIAAIAGVLCAPFSAFTATDGLILGINGFIALIVGGWGNPYAAVLGGILLGMLRALIVGYVSSAHAELATFLVLMVVLTLKPSGLFAGFMMPKTMNSAK